MSITPAIFGAITGAIGGSARTSLAQRLIREGNILTPTVSRASGTTSLLDGITRLANDAPASINRIVAGIQIPFYRVMPSCTNLVAAQATNTGLTTNVLSGISRTLTEDSSTGAHVANMAAAITLAAATSYWIGVAAKRGGGSRNLEVVAADGTNSAGISVDLGTGVATAITGGGGSVTLITSTLLPSGNYFVRALISSTAWTAASVAFRTGMLSGTSNSYTGGGSASVIVTGVTLTANILPTHLLPEAATDLADNIQSQSIILPQVGTVLNPFMSYGKNWAASTNEHGTNGRLYSIDLNLTIIRTTSELIQRTDAGGAQGPGGGAEIQVDRVAQTRSTTWDSVAVRVYRGSALYGSDTTLIPPYAGTSAPLYLGNTFALDRPAYIIAPMPLVFSRVLPAHEIAALDAAYVAAGNLVGSAF